jgi:hypothetical protein
MNPDKYQPLTLIPVRGRMGYKLIRRSAMSNMSYCRFENTYTDMKQCYYDLQEALEEGKTFDQFLTGLSSDYERGAVRSMVDLIHKMNDAFDELKSG